MLADIMNSRPGVADRLDEKLGPGVAEAIAHGECPGCAGCAPVGLRLLLNQELEQADDPKTGDPIKAPGIELEIKALDLITDTAAEIANFKPVAFKAIIEAAERHGIPDCEEAQIARALQEAHEAIEPALRTLVEKARQAATEKRQRSAAERAEAERQAELDRISRAREAAERRAGDLKKQEEALGGVAPKALDVPAETAQSRQ